EAALNNFDLDCVKRLNRGVRLARFHASLGEAFLAHGKLDRARAHFAAAKRWIDAFTVKPNNKSDWEQTLAVIRRLQIGIAQKEKSKL
ncbi:MAG: hypothetical protein K2Z81_21855, partial [Cyanobacteria bacterium]|nr:hypothetical protein [Cyanobacteriota bacterium]